MVLRELIELSLLNKSLFIGPWAISDWSKPMFYRSLDNNQINVRALIGQSAMAYCASKPMEKNII